MLYLFRLITPFSFRSVEAWFVISKDNGFVLQSGDVIGIGSNWDGWYGIDMVVEGLVDSIWSFGTITGGSMSSPGGVCDSWGTATDVRAFLLLCEGVSSDNMGSKEFSVGTFSFKEGTNFIKFPTV